MSETTTDAMTDVESVEAAQPVRWSVGTRLAFRFGFCYLMLYALCCGNACIWEIIPFHVGEHLEDWTSWPFFHGAQWLGQHWFHLTGVGAKLHNTGSGDTILNWIAVGIMLAVAIAAGLLWSLIDRRSTAYPRLFFWFRLTLRLTLGYAMLNYGFAKLFPLQMAPPSLAVLNEPLGNTSPMTMLWTLIGLNTLAAALAEEQDALEEVYEPFLIQIGFLDRTPRGRVATRLAYEHLGIEMPRRHTLFG